MIDIAIVRYLVMGMTKTSNVVWDREPLAFDETGQTRDIDLVYAEGFIDPRYPVPATLDNGNVAMIWTLFDQCDCAYCLANWMDTLK